ncbi:MAG: GldG family protein [Bacteroidia bacterium]
MKSRKSVFNFLILLTVVLIAVNFLCDRYFFRLDFTSDKRYTLSKATVDILKSIDKPITVKAYFSENLPPDIAKTKRDFKELLIEFASRSNGNVVYDFVNPGEKEEKEQEAMQSGVQPVMINVREKDQMKQQKAFLGAVIQMGDRKEVIPFMQPGSAMEYSLASNIKKLSVSEKPVIGLLQGHGEPSQASIQQAGTALSVLYNIEPFTQTDTTAIPDHFKTLVIIDPKDSFPETHLQQLDAFLSKGKNLFIAYSRQTADLQTSMANSKHTGLEDWLKNKNIEIEDKLIVDAACGSVQVRQQQGMFSYMTNLNFPYFPLVSNFADHPAVKGLEQIVLQFASPIVYKGDSSIKFQPIVKSSKKAGTQQAPVYFQIQKQWVESDFPMSEITIGAAFTGKISGSANSKMVVISNGNFAVNGEGQQANQLPPDNVNLLVNSIDWLSDDTGLIDLRTKGVTSRPLEQIEDGKKTFYKYLNFLLPLILIVAYGFVRMQMKRNLRVKRMDEDYI